MAGRGSASDGRRTPLNLSPSAFTWGLYEGRTRVIVAGWYDLKRAIDKAVPCYAPLDVPPMGREERCGDCDGCRDFASVEVALGVVENQVEEAFDEIERRASLSDPRTAAGTAEGETDG
jgi:hypothetical protein